MGVTCVCQWPTIENKTLQQTVELLSRRVELLGATKTGNFCVDCETYQSAPTISPSKLVHVMHSTEQPMSSYAITDTGNCLVTDQMFDGVMQRLKSFYTPRKSARIEAKGQRHELGDFVVKLGVISIGAHARGIIIEVEYTPCVVVADCWSLLIEFMQGFLGNQTPGMPNVLANKKDAPYTPMDTVAQYLEHFNHFRKSQGGR